MMSLKTLVKVHLKDLKGKVEVFRFVGFKNDRDSTKEVFVVAKDDFGEIYRGSDKVFANELYEVIIHNAKKNNKMIRKINIF